VPTSEQILTGLQLIASRTQPVGTLWHIAVFIALIAIISGWRPSRRTIALAAVLPLMSVAIVAFVNQGFFNGAMFTVVALTLALLGRHVPEDRPSRPSRWVLVLGIAMTILGFGYPHFLQGGSYLWYLYGGPLGELPCPTLSFVIGLALISDGVGSRAWSVLLAMMGLFYGVVGVAKLGVWLDAGLVVGAAGLAVHTFATARKA
jgi:hypothetical protein